VLDSDLNCAALDSQGRHHTFGGRGIFGPRTFPLPFLRLLSSTSRHHLSRNNLLTDATRHPYNMADDESSELSSISSLSAPPSDDESEVQLERQHGILKFFHKVDRNPELEPREPTPPRPKREPSPPHEYILADNSDIAVRDFAFHRVVESLRRGKFASHLELC
jgi:hypothetical protein